MLENTEGKITKRTIQRNCQHRVYKTKKNKTKIQHTMCWTPLYTNKQTNNVNKTCDRLQTTGYKDEPNIVFMRKSTQNPDSKDT